METVENIEMTKELNINGKNYRKIGDIHTVNGKYSFAYDGDHFNFTMTRQDSNSRSDNNGRYSLKENVNPVTNGVNIPMLTEKVVFASLCDKMQESFKNNNDFNKAVDYISFVNKEVNEFPETMDINFDFSTPEKALETERIFQEKCNELAAIIDEHAKQRLEQKENDIDKEDTKVLKLTPKKNNRAAFVDVIILCVVAQLTIFITVLAVLFVMNS